jgi:NitT/TauT family transport system ATP-binding protein
MNATATSSAICEARDVTVALGEPPRHVLEHINLAVHEGEVMALLGPSGCGKSTLLRTLVGLQQPTSGEVLANGQPLRDIHPGVSIVFQSFALLPWLTVLDNVAVGLTGLDVDPEMAQRRVRSCIELVGLDGFEEAYPRELSGGMKQRVGFARALVRNPQLLCMDEPFASLDVFTAEALRSEVYRLCVEADAPSSGAELDGLRSVLIITHQIEEAVFLADRIVVMSTNPGEIECILENPVPHPREYRSPQFEAMVQRVHQAMVAGEDLDEIDRIAGARDGRLESLPPVVMAEVTGVVEIVHDFGDRMSLFDLDEEADEELGRMLTVVKAGEMLDLLDTQGQTVALTPVGRIFVEEDVADRKRLLATQLKRLNLTRFIIDAVQQEPDQGLDREDLEETLAQRLPKADVKTTLETLLGWSRYAELLSFSVEDERIELGEALLNPDESSPTRQSP